jgi:glucose-induced degradation protein 4
MPVPREVTEIPLRNGSKQIGINKTLLYNGSSFKGYQKSKGNSYEVEVVLQVSL